MRAGLVGELPLMTIRTFGQRCSGQMVVRAAPILTAFGMTAFWIRHRKTPRPYPILGEGIVMGIPPRSQFFFEPFHLHTRQRSHARVARVGFTRPFLPLAVHTP